MNKRNRTITRRDSLRIGVAGGMGLTISNLLRRANADPKSSAKSKADSVLFVNLAGGPSHLDTLDIKPEAPAETKGPFSAIQTKLPGLAACEHLPKFAAIADQFTLLRGIAHSAGAHDQAQSWLSTGNRPTPALIFPSLGSIVSKERPGSPEIPPYVAIPKTEWNAGYLGDSFAAFKTNEVPRPGKPFQVRGISLPDGLTLEKVNRRQELLKKVDRTFREVETNSQLLEALDTFGNQAYSMITSARAQSAFDVRKEPAALQKLFSADELNQSLLLSCRLIEFGVPFVTVTNQGWDTHLDNFTGHKRLLQPLDAAIPATLQMLEAKGLLDRTLIVVMGEFGRTPKINGNAGRDHYPRANWCLLAGGGIRPGQLIGATDKKGESPTADTDISPDDISATILHALGIDPMTEYFTNTGRPAWLVPEGRIMTELF